MAEALDEMGVETAGLKIGIGQDTEMQRDGCWNTKPPAGA